MTTPEQPLLFVGSYADAGEPGIHAFRFDQATGALKATSSFSGIASPSFLTLHPSRPYLYAASEASSDAHGGSGAVWALRYNPDSGALEPINDQSSGGTAPCHLTLDATGEWLLAANYSSGSVGMYRVQADGSLSTMTDFIQHAGSGPNVRRQEGPHAHSATLTPDNRFAIVADLGLDQLIVYALDRAAGRLRAHAHTHTHPGAGPRHLAFHPNGRQVYLGNELDNTVNVLDYDAGSGGLTIVQTLDSLPDGAPENYIADVHVAPSGDRVYVSNRGHDSIAVFLIGADGRLERIATPSCGGNWPRNFAIAPGGQFVLVANQNSDNVAVLPVEAGAEGLGAACASVAVAKPSCVKFVAS